MTVMVIVKATAESEAGDMPSERLLEEVGRFNADLMAEGVLPAGEGLHPSSKGKRVHFSAGQATVTGGPFPRPTELVTGFRLWQVASMDEAVEWAQRIPHPEGEGESVVEIR